MPVNLQSAEDIHRDVDMWTLDTPSGVCVPIISREHSSGTGAAQDPMPSVLWAFDKCLVTE